MREDKERERDILVNLCYTFSHLVFTMLIVNLMLTVLQEPYIELEMVQEGGEREGRGDNE